MQRATFISHAKWAAAVLGLACGSAAADIPSAVTWTADVASLGCAADPPDASDLLKLALSWGTTGAAQLAGWQEAGITDYLERGGDFDRIEKAAEWTDFFLEQMPAAEAAFRREAAVRENDLCPMIAAISADDLVRYAAADRERPRRYRSHFWLAQSILQQQGCLADPPDGAFGPVSREAWNRAVRRVPDLSLGGAGRPAPGQVVALAALRAAGGLCGGSVMASSMDGTAVFTIAAACGQSSPDPRPVAAHLPARIEPNRLEAVLSAWLAVCPDPADRAGTAALLIDALFLRLPDATGLHAATAQAWAITRGLGVPGDRSGFADPEWTASILADLSGSAEQALSGQAASRPDAAAALLAAALDTPDAGPRPDLLSRIATGRDDLPLDPALRADIVRRYARAAAVDVGMAEDLNLGSLE